MARLRYRILLGLLVPGVLLFGLDRLFPPPNPSGPSAFSLVVVARDGTPLRAYPDSRHVWRHPVAVEDVSPYYLQALIAYEDRTFWWHPGINPYSLTRAALQWLWHGRIVSGGSTLTMQVARILEPIARTPAGKLKQLARALQLELRYSKREILTMYLNNAPMGGVLQGVEAAARTYLGKPSSRLTHAEAALLAVLPQAPSLLRPDRGAKRARIARDKVLVRMQGRWGDAVVADALSEPVYAHSLKSPLLAPLLAERLRRNARGVLRIETTIDPSLQSMLELLLLDRARGFPAHVSAAAIVIDNATLEVVAYAGSADFSDPGRASHVDMVRAWRSPGSTLKPFLYAFALDDGLIHSESLLADVPQSFGGYQPGNFQQSFHGPVSVSEALTLSLNVPAVEVLDRIGAVRFVSQLRRGGLMLDFPTGAAPNLSVILGGAGVTLENLTGAYTAFARAGLAGKPRFTRDEPHEDHRMMSAGAAYIVRSILESGGSVNRAMQDAARPRIAWKTGTSFGFRDAWAVGVSDRYAVGVWVGRPDGTPNPGSFGANTAAPLLVDIFAALPAPAPFAPNAVPATVSQARICWPLGTRLSTQSAAVCHVQRTAWLLNDTAPPTFPDRLRPGEPRREFHVQARDGLRAEPGCAAGALQRVEAARWPALLEPWLNGSLRQKALLPEWSKDCSTGRLVGGTIRIFGASDGEILHRAGNTAPLVRLELRGHHADAHWLVNGRLVAHTREGESYAHRFTDPGRYEVTAFDNGGHYDRISVSVR
jgi:penicillin-binding protein 1C